MDATAADALFDIRDILMEIGKVLQGIETELKQQSKNQREQKVMNRERAF